MRNPIEGPSPVDAHLPAADTLNRLIEGVLIIFSVLSPLRSTLFPVIFLLLWVELLWLPLRWAVCLNHKVSLYAVSLTLKRVAQIVAGHPLALFNLTASMVSWMLANFGGESLSSVMRRSVGLESFMSAELLLDSSLGEFEVLQPLCEYWISDSIPLVFLHRALFLSRLLFTKSGDLFLLSLIRDHNSSIFVSRLQFVDFVPKSWARNPIDNRGPAI